MFQDFRDGLIALGKRPSQQGVSGPQARHVAGEAFPHILDNDALGEG